MKRLLLPASALVLVVTACGAGAKPAPRVTEVKARVASVHAIVVRRERAARREAQQLLHEFVLPPGAGSIREPRGYGGLFGQSGPEPLAEVADAHRFWAVRESLAAVMAFVRAHTPHGFASWGSSFGNQPHNVSLSFARPAGGEPSRILNVTAAALPGRTVMRVDATAVWIYPRAPSEEVPPATSEIVVHAPRISATVTSRAKVTRIVRWFDVLPVSPPGVVVACPAIIGADITLSFRNMAGRQLAEAKVPPRAATVCDAIAFQIGRAAQKPLVDRGTGESFVRRLQRLLGLHLVRTDR